MLGLRCDVPLVQALIAAKLKEAVKTNERELEVQFEKKETAKSLRDKFDAGGLLLDFDVTVRACDSLNKVIWQTLGAAAMSKAERIVHEYLLAFYKLNQVVWPTQWPVLDGGYDPTVVGYQYVEVERSTDEWQFVQDHFGRKNFAKEITVIQRVQNPLAWNKYYFKRKCFADRNKQASADDSMEKRANERWMKHGCRDKVIDANGDVLFGGPDTIAMAGGLDWRFSGQGMYGQSAYTAEDTQYSHANYRTNLPDGIHAQLFLVRVAAGDMHECAEHKTEYGALKIPPNGKDSVRGPVGGGHIAIMVYDQDLAYPAYLITYKK